MKKIWAFLLAALLLLSIAACGKTDEAPDASAAMEGTRPIETMPRSTAAPTEPTETLPQGPITIEKTDVDLMAAERDYSIPDFGDEQPHLEEQVLFDDGTVRLTTKACDLVPDFTGYYNIPVVLENNSDLYLKSYTYGSAINGRSAICGLFASAEPYSTAEDSIVVIQSDLNRAARGFDVPRDFQMQVAFVDVDGEEGSNRYAVGDIVSFSTEPAYYAKDTFSHYQTLLYKSENFCVYGGKVYLSQNKSSYFQLSIENYSDTVLSMQAENISINGEAEDDQKIGNILPGCTKICYLEFHDVGAGLSDLPFADFSELGLQFVAHLDWDGEVIDSSDILCLKIQ